MGYRIPKNFGNLVSARGDINSYKNSFIFSFPLVSTAINHNRTTMSFLSFPQKLNILLDTCKRQGETSIIWRPDGYSFQVVQKERFAKNVMPVFFRSNNYNTVSLHDRTMSCPVFSNDGCRCLSPRKPSIHFLFQFKRNLNLWGFRAITKELGWSIYFHEDFQEGRPELCHTMTRNGLYPPSDLAIRTSRRWSTTYQRTQDHRHRRIPPLLPRAQSNLIYPSTLPGYPPRIHISSVFSAGLLHLHLKPTTLSFMNVSPHHLLIILYVKR